MGIARRYKAVVPRPKRPTLTSLILEKIAEAGEIFIGSFFPAKYPEARLWRTILGLDASYEFKPATFSTILSQLRVQGLVARRTHAGRHYWRITPAGRTAAAAGGSGPPHPDGRHRLVCFDIPEREQAKRRWLRGELIALGYRALQKSVWIGQTPLPTDFIASLDALNLRGKVHILEVKSAGTIIEA